MLKSKLAAIGIVVLLITLSCGSSYKAVPYDDNLSHKPEIIQASERLQTDVSAQKIEFAVAAISLQASVKAGTIFPPVMPKGTPAPAQIKRLDASGMACLTFDDGYSEYSINTILNCLRENNVHCTFFVIGACLKEYPNLWRQAIADGNEIAYHSMYHDNLNKKSNLQIVYDLNLWNQTAHNILGADYNIPKIARAPYGSADTRVRKLFYCLGYKLIYWSSDTFTGVYASNHSNYASRISSYIIRKTSAGSISLQHFNRYDAASISRYIAALKTKCILGKSPMHFRLRGRDVSEDHIR